MDRQLGKFLPEEPAITENGYWKGRFGFDGNLLHIIVMPENFNTVYDFGLKDEDNMVIFYRYNIKGILSEPVNIAVFPGEKNIILENVIPDTTFKIKLIYQL